MVALLLILNQCKLLLLLEVGVKVEKPLVKVQNSCDGCHREWDEIKVLCRAGHHSSMRPDGVM